MTLKDSRDQTIRTVAVLKYPSTVSGARQLRRAHDWKMLADIGQQLVFPPEMASTNLRPDLVLWSPSLKTAYITELTVPWENSIEEAYEHKKLHYAALAAEVKQRGWNTKVYPVEVGCRGFVASSTIRLWEGLRCHGQALRKTMERSSQWIWLGKYISINHQRTPCLSTG